MNPLVYFTIVHRFGDSLSIVLTDPVIRCPGIDKPNLITHRRDSGVQVGHEHLLKHLLGLRLVLGIDPQQFWEGIVLCPMLIGFIGGGAD